MRKIVTANEMKQLEQYTINTLGVPSIALMERAASSVVKHIKKGSSVLVICGTGNNGADGLAVARMCHIRGDEVRIYIVGDMDKATKEFLVQRTICDNLDIELLGESPIEPDVIVDAIFGIGISREVTDEYLEAIKYINSFKSNNKSKIISVDVPSGLNCDSGKPQGISVDADMTITFQHEKLGLILNDGPKYSGEVVIEDVGIASNENSKFTGFTYEEDDIKRFPKRDTLGNKSTFGKVLLITGSDNMPGASILTAKAAFCTGAGMVKVISSKGNRDLLMHELPEAMFKSYDEMTIEDLELELNWCDACLIGPGLNISDISKYLVSAVLGKCTKPVILDADGLNIQAANDLEGIRKRGQKGYETILTPHPAEFARLTRMEPSQKKNHNIDFVGAIARNNFCMISAKDARTIVSKGEKPVYINTVTSDALATAGSGDIYAAIITAFVARGIEMYEAICLATLVHGMAGKCTADNKGNNASSASDVIKALADLMKE